MFPARTSFNRGKKTPEVEVAIELPKKSKAPITEVTKLEPTIVAKIEPVGEKKTDDPSSKIKLEPVKKLPEIVKPEVTPKVPTKTISHEESKAAPPPVKVAPEL